MRPLSKKLNKCDRSKLTIFHNEHNLSHHVMLVFQLSANDNLDSPSICAVFTCKMYQSSVFLYF